jgi:type II secretory pathway pseudopilin PulG
MIIRLKLATYESCKFIKFMIIRTNNNFVLPVYHGSPVIALLMKSYFYLYVIFNWQIPGSMKNVIRYIIILSAVAITWSAFPKQTKAQRAYVSFQVFYDQLSPYGRWVDYPDFGYVWFPDVGPGFQPYFSNGHWIFTEFGWMWISDYPWGWAAFHYGRWAYDNIYGWYWIPGDAWGPAWVVWVSSGDYYGWAPMGPGISIRISFGINYYRRIKHWVFVRNRYIYRNDIIRYRVRRTDNDRLIKNSRIIDNTYRDSRRGTTYIYGPRRPDVQRASGRTFHPVRIENNNRPGQNIRKDRIQIYRPEVKRDDGRGRNSSPSDVTRRKDLKKPSDRTRKRTTKPQPTEKQKKADQRRDSKGTGKGAVKPEKKDDRRRDSKGTVKSKKKDDKKQPTRKKRSKSKKKNDGKDRRDNR